MGLDANDLENLAVRFGEDFHGDQVIHVRWRPLGGPEFRRTITVY